MTIKIPKSGSLSAFAIIVDLNSFTPMVNASQGDLIAQYVRDILYGSIRAVENNGGAVVGFMGDAILGIIEKPDAVFGCCCEIAKDLDEQCEYISKAQEDNSSAWEYSPGGPSLKILVEYGTMDISTISSDFLGEHPLLIGDPINYASRIGNFGKGNRLLLGPVAARLLKGYSMDGPFSINGKNREENYECYQIDLGDIWRENLEKESESYLG